MTTVDKLAVFDLDGTLWDKNSHYEILNAYFKTTFYTSFLFRIIFHFFKRKTYNYICKKYEKIPKDFVFSFDLKFNKKTLDLLMAKKNEGFFPIIVSNAPYEIIVRASQRLSLPFLKAPIGKKKSKLDSEYTYLSLFVCTDNVDDLDLITASNSYEIIFTKRNRKFFSKLGFEENK